MKKKKKNNSTTDFNKIQYKLRKNEINSILEELKKNKNLLLTSPNGWGKKTILQYLIKILKDDFSILSLNVFGLTSEEVFLQKLYSSLKEKANSGISINANDVQWEKVLDEFLLSLQKREKKLLLILDDYTGLFELKESIFYEKLFPKLVSANNVYLLLSGIKNIFPQKLINEFKLKKPTSNRLRKYIIEQLNLSGKKISEKAIDEIIDWSRCEPNAINMILEQIIIQKEDYIRRKNLPDVFTSTLTQFELSFKIIKSLLSQYQWKLLLSISNEREATLITSASFIEKNKLNAPSSVKTALDALIDKGLVIKSNQTYQISNVILMNWLNNI